MIEVVCSENGNIGKRSYPFLAKNVTEGFIVIATGDGEGFALGGSCAFDCRPKAVTDWADWEHKNTWEILPAGTTITLTVK